jgi:hypothetical protein
MEALVVMKSMKILKTFLTFYLIVFFLTYEYYYCLFIPIARRLVLLLLPFALAKAREKQ